MSLRALARFCYRRRRRVAMFWFAALVGINVLAAATGTNCSTNFTAPNTIDARLANLLAANFKAQSGDAVQVVMRGTPAMKDAAVEQQVKAFLAGARARPPRRECLGSVRDARGYLEVRNDRVGQRAARRTGTKHSELRGPRDDQARREILYTAARGSARRSADPAIERPALSVRASGCSPRSSSC